MGLDGDSSDPEVAEDPEIEFTPDQIKKLRALAASVNRKKKHDGADATARMIQFITKKLKPKSEDYQQMLNGLSNQLDHYFTATSNEDKLRQLYDLTGKEIPEIEEEVSEEVLNDPVTQLAEDVINAPDIVDSGADVDDTAPELGDDGRDFDLVEEAYADNADVDVSGGELEDTYDGQSVDVDTAEIKNRIFDSLERMKNSLIKKDVKKARQELIEALDEFYSAGGERYDTDRAKLQKIILESTKQNQTVDEPPKERKVTRIPEPAPAEEELFDPVDPTPRFANEKEKRQYKDAKIKQATEAAKDAETIEEAMAAAFEILGGVPMESREKENVATEEEEEDRILPRVYEDAQGVVDELLDNEYDYLREVPQKYRDSLIRVVEGYRSDIKGYPDGSEQQQFSVYMLQGLVDKYKTIRDELLTRGERVSEEERVEIDARMRKKELEYLTGQTGEATSDEEVAEGESTRVQDAAEEAGKQLGEIAREGENQKKAMVAAEAEQAAQQAQAEEGDGSSAETEYRPLDMIPDEGEEVEEPGAGFTMPTEADISLSQFMSDDYKEGASQYYLKPLLYLLGYEKDPPPGVEKIPAKAREILAPEFIKKGLISSNIDKLFADDDFWKLPLGDQLNKLFNNNFGGFIKRVNTAFYDDQDYFNGRLMERLNKQSPNQARRRLGFMGDIFSRWVGIVDDS